MFLFGPSGETRTRGILVPNQAPYQLGHTRIFYCFSRFREPLKGLLFMAVLFILYYYYTRL